MSDHRIFMDLCGAWLALPLVYPIQWPRHVLTALSDLQSRSR